MDITERELLHFGVLGMKWGVRRRSKDLRRGDFRARITETGELKTFRATSHYKTKDGQDVWGYGVEDKVAKVKNESIKSTNLKNSIFSGKATGEKILLAIGSLVVASAAVNVASAVGYRLITGTWKV